MQEENKFGIVIDDLELEKVIGGVNYEWMRTEGKPDSSQIVIGSVRDFRNDPEPGPSDGRIYVQTSEADPNLKPIVSQGSGGPEVSFGPSQPGADEGRFATAELTHF